MPVTNFALEIQLVWPPEASMGHWLSLISLICATWGPVPLVVKISGFPHLTHFHCLCPPTWTGIHSSGTTHETCLQLPEILSQELNPESLLQQSYLRTSHKSQHRKRRSMKKQGNVFLPEITNAMKRVQMKMIQNFQQRIKNNDYNYVQTH